MGVVAGQRPISLTGKTKAPIPMNASLRNTINRITPRQLRIATFVDFICLVTCFIGCAGAELSSSGLSLSTTGKETHLRNVHSQGGRANTAALEERKRD